MIFTLNPYCELSDISFTKLHSRFKVQVKLCLSKTKMVRFFHSGTSTVNDVMANRNIP